MKNDECAMNVAVKLRQGVLAKKPWSNDYLSIYSLSECYSPLWCEKLVVGLKRGINTFDAVKITQHA